MIVTDELISPGHPDKIADLISDTILTKALKNNKNTKVACETFATGTSTGGLVVVGGEISKDNNITNLVVTETVLEVLNKTIKTNFKDFDKNKVKILNKLTNQSSEINKAVTDKKNVGAGDQGIMVGYATNENKNFMPENFNKCIILQKHLYKLQQKSHLLDLDSKVQITNFNDTFKIVVSTQHKQNANLLKLEKNIQKIIKKYITKNKFELLLNPSGSFVKGGIAADTGLTGRKIVADAYGSLIPVGGGAFSGKDPTKVDRSGAYAARHLAKNIVAHNLADKCLVRLSYAIGVAEPLEISINTFNTQKVKSVDLQNFINKFDMRPASIIERLDLLNVDYTKDTMFSHFGHNNRNWEKIENV